MNNIRLLFKHIKNYFQILLRDLLNEDVSPEEEFYQRLKEQYEHENKYI